MDNRLRRRAFFAYTLFFLIISLSTPLLAFGDRYRTEGMAIDARNCGKGCGSMLSKHAHFIYNPAVIMFQKRFIITGLYNFKESGGILISDSKSSRYGGGLAYTRYDDINIIKTNFSMPMGKNFSFGTNINYFNGDMYEIQRKDINTSSFDFGVAAQLFDMLYIGFAALNAFSITKTWVPVKLSTQVEITFFKQMLSLNTAFIFHVQPEKEKIHERRSDLRYVDFAAGAEFKWKIIIVSMGFHNSSFEKDFTWESLTKTYGFSLYMMGKGGLSSTFYWQRDNYGFTIDLSFEPSPQGN
ncbi:hypothetical protein KAH37_01500 [bacterium]|nr:hypothetical protein [bacterium]